MLTKTYKTVAIYLFCMAGLVHNLQAQTNVNSAGTDSLMFYNGAIKTMTLTNTGKLRLGEIKSPHISAILQLNSTTGGLLIPRMTTAQRNTLAIPVAGLLIFNSTTNEFEIYKAGAWNTILTSSGGVWTKTGGKVFTATLTDSIGIGTAIPNNIFEVKSLLKFADAAHSTFIGDSAGIFTSGVENTFVGAYAGKNNSTGGKQTFIGFRAGFNNSTGGWNLFVGRDAGFTNTIGNSNVMLGYAPGFLNSSGSNNTYIGYLAGRNATGSNNHFVGNWAGFNNTTGVSNTFIGYHAGEGNISGNNNLFIGFQAGKINNTTGSNNMFIGYNTGLATATQRTNAAAIGYGAKVDTSNAMVLGGTGANAINVGIGTTKPNAGLHINTTNAIISRLESSNAQYAFEVVEGTGAATIPGYVAIHGVDTVMMGFDPAQQAMFLSHSSPGGGIHLEGDTISFAGVQGGLSIGYFQGDFSIDTVEAFRFYVGEGAGVAGNVLTDDGSGRAVWTAPGGGSSPWTKTGGKVFTATLTDSIGIGTAIPNNLFEVVGLVNFDDLKQSTFLGKNAGSNNTGIRNTFIGYFSGASNTGGAGNVANGTSSLYFNTTGGSNSAFGYTALFYNTTGGSNTANGSSSLFRNTTGNNNVAMGRNSLNKNTTGNSNTVLGTNAGFKNTTGSRNVFVGDSAGYHIIGNDNVMLGYGAGIGVLTGNDKLYIGNKTFNSLITGDFLAKTVSVAGSFTVGGVYTLPAIDGLANQVLETNGAGTLSWVTPTSGGGAAGGDLLGTYPSPNVRGIQGSPVTTITPIGGQVLKYNGTTFKYELQNMNADYIQNFPVTTITPTAGDILSYDGTKWITAAPAGGGSSPWTKTGASVYNTTLTDKIGVGISTPSFQFHQASDLQSAHLIQTSSLANYSIMGLGRTRGSIVSPTTPVLGDIIGQVAYLGHNGTSFQESATIDAKASESHSSIGTGGELHFKTTPNGTLTSQDRMTIDNAGNVGIGTTAPSEKLHLENGVFMMTTVTTPATVIDRLYNTGGNLFWNGTQLDAIATASAWGLLGNTGTVSGTNFIGNIDSVSIDFRTNNLITHRFTTKGQIEVLNTGQSVFIGEGAGASDDLSINENVFIGYQAGASNTTGFRNVAIGSLAGNAFAASTTENVAIGTYALQSTTSNWNTAVGYNSLPNNTIGQQNTAVGTNALKINTTASRNSAFGYAALNSGNGTENSAFGVKTLYQNTGLYNVAMGNSAITNKSGGNYNTAMGYRAMRGGVLTTFNNNTAVGGYSLDLNQGDNNTALGYAAGNTITTGTNNTFLGYNADATVATLVNATAIGANAIVSSSNAIVLGNNANIGIGTTAPVAKLEISHNSTINNAHIRLLESNTTDGARIFFENTQTTNKFTLFGNPNGVDANAIFNFHYTTAPNFGNIMTLKGDGNVGIGTTAPGQKLEVVGNVAIPAGNAYTYTAPKTNYLSISAKAFNSGQPEIDFWDNSLNLIHSYFKTTSTNASPLAVSGVNLPNGATITNVTFYIKDTDGSVVYQPRFSFYRVNMATGAYNLITSKTLAADAPAIQALTTNIIATPLIDNNNYQYFLKYQTIKSGGESVLLYGAKITYTVNQAD